MTRTSLLAAASAAAALAAFPAVASAAPVAAVNGTTVTITGDATPETITIAEAGGQITLNGANVGAAANNTFDLVVNAGAGDDVIAVNTTNLLSVTVNGDAGNDVITGSGEADALNGGDNNDRVVGAQGPDTMTGGNGNDVLVWNPGDGSDKMDGDAGADDIELNGGNGAEQFAAAPNGARVTFERVSPGAFTLDVATAERLVLNGNGGDDSMASSPALTVPVLLNGGVGADSLTGGGAADFVNGGDDNDVLDGGPGIDRLVGDRGADTMRGAGEDDTLVWNNGDGSDLMDGQDGLDRIEVNGAAGAGDAFEIAANGQRAKFDRTNLGPFTLDIGTAELLDVRGQGGDDTFLARSGNPLAVLADGGAGNDTLTGAEEADTLLGGTGNDAITGGGGPDLLDGQDGDDTLNSVDGVGDLVRGGANNDTATADSPRIDAIDGVETVVRPAPADEIATPVSVLGRQAAIRIDRRGRATTRLRLECPAAEAGGCDGRLTLLSARTFKVAGARVRLVLGSARFDLDAGERARVTVRLPKGARRLARNGRIAVLAQTASRDAAGNLAQDSKRVSLKLPRR